MGDGVRASLRGSIEDPSEPAPPCELQRSPRQAQLQPVLGFERLEVTPADSAPPPRPDRLHARFLDGKAQCKVWCGAATPPAVSLLERGEQAIAEARTAALAGQLESRGLAHVDA